jgi:hypothetical protein
MLSADNEDARGMGLSEGIEGFRRSESTADGLKGKIPQDLKPAWIFDFVSAVFQAEARRPGNDHLFTVLRGFPFKNSEHAAL